MELPKLQQLAEAKDPKTTITVKFSAEDEHNFPNSLKAFKKLSGSKPEADGRKMSSKVTGTKRDLISFLSSDDGAGYDITYIKKNYPDLYK